MAAGGDDRASIALRLKHAIGVGIQLFMADTDAGGAARHAQSAYDVCRRGTADAYEQRAIRDV